MPFLTFKEKCVCRCIYSPCVHLGHLEGNTTLAGPEQLKSIKSQVGQADIIESLVRKGKVQVMHKIPISKAQEAQTKSYV